MGVDNDHLVDENTNDIENLVQLDAATDVILQAGDNTHSNENIELENTNRTTWADMAEEGVEVSRDSETEGEEVVKDTWEHVLDIESVHGTPILEDYLNTQRSSPMILNRGIGLDTRLNSVVDVQLIGEQYTINRVNSNAGSQQENKDGEWEEHLSKSQKKGEENSKTSQLKIFPSEIEPYEAWGP